MTALPLTDDTAPRTVETAHALRPVGVAAPSASLPTLGEYLRARRNVIDPAATSVWVDDSRRVAGLRREEVAALAGISPEYYVRLEQGRDHQPSEQVLEALARALQVGSSGLAYMRRLAVRTHTPSAPRRESVLRQAGPLLEAWSHVPAYVTDPNFDVVHTNTLASRLSGGRFAVGVNVAIQFCSPEVRAQQPHWHAIVETFAAWLRMTARQADPRATDVRATLLRNDDFRRAWARHDVGPMSGNTVWHSVGPFPPLPFEFVTVELSGASGYLLVTYHAEPGTRSAAALAWARAMTEAA